jgi:hypothetical protein
VPRKIFVAGEILTAADVNTNLMDQAVMVFDDAAARDTAIPSPSEGMVVYLKDTDAVLSYSGSAWVPAVNTASIVDGAVTSAKLGAGTILQVLQAVRTAQHTETHAQGGETDDLPGLSLSITPRATSSKILVLANVSASMTGGGGSGVNLRLYRGGTLTTFVGDDTANNRVRVAVGNDSATRVGVSLVLNFLDSPNSTSAQTYTLRGVGAGSSTNTFILNRGSLNDNDSTRSNSASSLILMEVAG